MRKILLSVVMLCMAFATKADEGMWLLRELNKESVSRMKELGFTFPINKLYDENNPSLKDAVVIFGGGCSGVAVSEQGLIFTNHHCGYGAIQKLSSVEHDYLQDGFAAANQPEELYADGLTVSFLRSMSDVTDRILSNIPSVLSEMQREATIDSLSDELVKSYENDPFVRARVIPFYSRNKYYLVLYDVFRDVRLTVTPPSSVGKYGGDTDNWIWPRHTGDFSVFRVYADKNNKPARHSADNVPYRPKYVVPVSLAGVKDNDYAMTIGYPGSTERYLSSWGIRQRMESENKPRIDVRDAKQAIWREAMNANDTIRIKYANKFAGSSNYWKNSIGMNEAILNRNVLQEKETIESRLQQWIDGNPARKAKYGNTLATLRDAYTSTNAPAAYSTYFLETFNNGIELIRFANTILHFDTKTSEEDKQAFINERIIESYKDYEPALDKKVLSALLKLYAERVPEEYHPGIYTKIKEEFGGDYDRYGEWLFTHSQFTNLDNLLSLLKTNNTDSLMKDPAMELALSATEAGYKLSGQLMPTYDKILQGEREFMAALMEMSPDKNFYPDATFTQRLSYGSVKGYQPRDAVWYDYYTTAQGVFEKYKENDPEFHVQPYILDALRSRDYGRYAAPDGLLHVNFLSNNDITGGNSGSPVFNGKAELIGLAFDGNWEALSGDLIFEPEVQRTISVDIRYVLFMIDKVMKAPHIIRELQIPR
ncbi:S46 family peptidase [Limibacterium fermenti]|uniref:S46 family peptidase n=1 Tax=Limibacterium fermenti TaxID=3229863 RepID=UPI000E92C4E1|nr:peptidase S10 [Porphyromonadaceae bacterium]